MSGHRPKHPPVTLLLQDALSPNADVNQVLLPLRPAPGILQSTVSSNIINILRTPASGQALHPGGEVGDKQGVLHSRRTGTRTSNTTQNLFQKYCGSLEISQEERGTILSHQIDIGS